jgi:purine-binding chemotaxis protein CheW
MEQNIELQSMDDVSIVQAERAGKYLTFTLSKQEYGVGIRKVREIMGMLPITALPQAPQHIKGVINLRGKVIPIVDLRLKFGIAPTPKTDQECIIVVEIDAMQKDLLIGVLVDSVSEVIDIHETDIEDTPSLGVDVNTNFILGMAKVGKGIKILLDIDFVLGREELNTLSAATIDKNQEENV